MDYTVSELAAITTIGGAVVGVMKFFMPTIKKTLNKLDESREPNYKESLDNQRITQVVYKEGNLYISVLNVFKILNEMKRDSIYLSSKGKDKNILGKRKFAATWANDKSKNCFDEDLFELIRRVCGEKDRFFKKLSYNEISAMLDWLISSGFVVQNDFNGLEVSDKANDDGFLKAVKENPNLLISLRDVMIESLPAEERSFWR